MEKENKSEGNELRNQIRNEDTQNAIVEFQPQGNMLAYQFPLRDWSESGLGILARQDSRLLKHLEAGQTLSALLHWGGRRETEEVRVEIRHISDPEQGRHPGHKIVGLSILEKEPV